MLELDVQATKDGVVVVIHDEEVDRTCDGTGRVRDLTWVEISSLDAGYHFKDLRGEHTFRNRGVRVPRFEDVLEALPQVRINVEAKDSRSAGTLVHTISRHGAQARVLVAAERERNRRDARGYGGPWGASRGQLTRFLLLVRTPLASLYTPRCEVLQVPEVHRGVRIVSPRFIQEAHRRNLPIHVWTVDDPEDMKRLLAWGVDGIQTDRPDLLAGVLSETVGRPPAPAHRMETE
jgi:glycerophosphoryl diester phosphodiesterase